jgi:hypothetical protein
MTRCSLAYNHKCCVFIGLDILSPRWCFGIQARPSRRVGVRGSRRGSRRAPTIGLGLPPLSPRKKQWQAKTARARVVVSKLAALLAERSGARTIQSAGTDKRPDRRRAEWSKERGLCGMGRQCALKCERSDSEESTLKLSAGAEW